MIMMTDDYYDDYDDYDDYDGYDDDYDNKLASRMLDIGAVSRWNKKALTSRQQTFAFHDADDCDDDGGHDYCDHRKRYHDNDGKKPL